jgi:excisionase family DNA binding protein
VLLTVKEVAEILRVCTATVYSMVERGELKHVRVSNAIRIVVGPAKPPDTEANASPVDWKSSAPHG